jgi:uroporphyrinogen decarboxylase
MTPRERVIKALRFEGPDRVPRHLWRLPGTKMFRQADVDRVLAKYPEDITILDFAYGKGRLTRGERYRKDQKATDEWGCTWRAAEDGVTGEVKEPPLEKISDVEKLHAPYEILDGGEFDKVNSRCEQTDTFTLGWTTVRPFERMQFLLGTEKLFIELTYASADMMRLRDILHDFYMEDIRRWVATDIDGISFMDDWGSQQSLLISPKMWCDIFKPLYKDYCDLIHAHGKYAFMHSDGNIEKIYPELIEVGVDAVNSQLFCMDIEQTVSKYKGRIAFWGEIDRQHILPFGTKEEIAEAVGRVKDALWAPQGGVIAQCEFGLNDPTENIEAVFEAWDSVV